ncbi:hypothetical protein EHI8A_062330 [Entamoeba histolytica HM-1:IMSS-B]|uniref:Uncharacterized protein n=5 Tax=Entamoeba histolytica TaxID=5759 RepID=C4LUM7_ENTH1|nr:hypothetical protein EHI_023150 [Entamoeba histolytica HM-1:IMSS]EMD42767.1 Hypothetical protein EHI5A_006170 [Entamoeba histolytica KU27]EMH73755.1 hypothetical protein EHI8A_062330 [Entamoeba histolytica HM-1:IMSS-B]ENY62836.1 hypothetical protein EHI7A_060010 [Entamoeba histolytica HM-1:IMSS-A]GAT92326.1 hypothetical protein CL6EHI_023150 [Entamoeba histolytica]EAL50273.1 hypothetical protein EHI_023150 [Entamoeba histolytica HM-1:IMSS]|eukprot:XP_655657.1 hypothetical protein EHI_023150 [Entamoeba histolytica HM-1:IMSS]
MKTLEPFYLANVALYLKGTTLFQSFIKISKNCENAIKMLHINPYNVIAYLPYLIKVITNINALYINALEAQELLTSEEVEKITWIDSTKNQCEISKLNETISEKVLNVRINNSQIPFLYKLKNVQKVIIEQITNINKQGIDVLTHLQVVKMLVLYFNTIDQKSIDLIVRYSQQNPHVVIHIVVDDDVCNRIGETKNIHYFNYIKQKKDIVSEEVMTFNNYILEEETILFRLNKCLINRIKKVRIETDILDSKSLCLNNYLISKLSITIHKGCTFLLKLPSGLEKLKINAPKCIVLMKDTEDWRIASISLKCDIRIVDNELKEVSKVQTIYMNNFIGNLEFVSYNGKYKFIGACNLVTLHLECAFDYLDLKPRNVGMWWKYDLKEYIIINRWCNCTINFLSSSGCFKHWFESGAYEMKILFDTQEKMTVNQLVAHVGTHYLKARELIRNIDNNTFYKHVSMVYNTKPDILLELSGGLKKIKCHVTRYFEMIYDDDSNNHELKHGVYVFKSKELNELDKNFVRKHILKVLTRDRKIMVDNESSLEIKKGEDYLIFNDFLVGYGSKNNKSGVLKIPVDEDEVAIIYFNNSLSISTDSQMSKVDNNQKVLYKDSLKENKYKPKEMKRLFKENKKEEALELLDYENEEEYLDEEAEQYLWKE